MSVKYTQYAFINYLPFINNNPYDDSVVGEFPQFGHTFNLDITRHTHPAYKDVQLIGVDTQLEKDDVKTMIEPNSDIVTLCLRIGQFLFTRAHNGINPTDKPIYLQGIVEEFNSVLEIKQLGALIHKEHYVFPEYITFRVHNYPDDNEVFLWFAKEAFIGGYPNFIHKPVLPFENMDKLMGSRESVINLIKTLTPETHNRAIMETRTDIPETHFETMMFNWVDPSNNEFILPIPFSMIVHGPRGINSDAYKETWRNTILKNSQYSKDEWVTRLPEIFTPNEFYIVPIWDRYALPNQVKSTGVYASTLPYTDILKYAVQYFKGYDERHIVENTTVSGAVFSSIMFIAIGHAQNFKLPSRFDWAWPGYNAIDTRDPAFLKLNTDTRALVYLLNELFYHCETATEYSLIPKGFTRVEREGVTYLTKSLNNVNYIMPVKANFKLEVDNG